MYSINIVGNKDKPFDVTTQYMLSSGKTISGTSENLQLKSMLLFSNKIKLLDCNELDVFIFSISFLTGNSHTAQLLPITTKYYFRQSEKNPVVFDNHHSFTKNKIQPMYIYLLVGLGVAFVLFIVIMIIELYRKVKFGKGKIVIEQPCNDTSLRGESSNQSSGTLCKTSSRQSKGIRLHPSVDIEYAEINEFVEMQTNNCNVTINGRPGMFSLRQLHNT